MKIGVFTEGNWFGKVKGNTKEVSNWLFENMRTDVAWWYALDAIHHPIETIPIIDDDTYDLGIIILPKDHVKSLAKVDVIGELKRKCKLTSVMQEGPQWYFQDYSIEEQVWFYNTLVSFDIIFAHNKIDVGYYKGLTNKKHVYQNPSLMIEDNIKPTTKAEDRNGVIIGGNFCRWYGGFDSYIIAQEFGEDIFAPSMGRKIDNEEQMGELTHLPYMTWVEWINNLSKYKYAVHLMPTQAAGTFALNCAYHGIPCIGYVGLDTQELCFPHLTVEMGDLQKAKQLAQRLKTDKEFYDDCSKISKKRYNECFSEKEYIYTMNKVIGGVINETN